MTVGAVDPFLGLVRSVLSSIATTGASTRVLTEMRSVLRYLSIHTGVPALVLAALVVCVGYRVLKRTVRFAIEVAAVALLLLFASELGWIRW